ncbi:ABC transporter, ATP-binding protein, partial [Ostertagia ostertagi]
MGFCPQHNCLFDHLTVVEHFWFFYTLKEGGGDWEQDSNKLCLSLGMENFKTKVTVLLGHNGAGKTTTYSMICGSTTITSGSITILGQNLQENLSVCRSNMGFCPQHNCLFDHLTVVEHFWFFYTLKEGGGDWEQDSNKLCLSLGMENFKTKLASKLSGGEKRKLCLAMAFTGGSKILMLDEPTAGMDPQARKTVTEFITKKKEN